MTPPASPPAPAGSRWMLAVDLDGTLIVDHRIAQRDIDALARWRQAGHLLVLATGRSSSLVGHAVALAARNTTGDLHYDYAVCSTGAVVADGEGTVLVSRAVPSALVAAMAGELSQRQDCALFAASHERDFIIHDPLDFMNDQRLEHADFTELSVPQLAQEEIVALPVHVPDAQVAQTLAEEIVRSYAPHVDATRSPGFVDITPAGVSKGDGLARLRSYLEEHGQAPVGIAAVGDSWNDLPMLTTVERPFLMDTAAPDVREAVQAEAVSNVAQVVEQLLSGSAAAR